ncbi:MAG: hypothetical protein JSR45_02505 [Proteobacteria bacterium]|nr:hypothetical protein [Pseudomonadota bacterium]
MSGPSAVRVTHADDLTLHWGGGHEAMGRYVSGLTALAPDQALANARVEMAALQLPDRAFPIALPRGPQACWLTSLGAAYGKAARDEIAREPASLGNVLFALASRVAETWIALTRADDLAFINHPLFSTSLYGDWEGDGLEPAMQAVIQACPDRAIAWRSLNRADNARLIDSLTRLGARLLPSRIVWRIENPSTQWAPRTDVRADLRLAQVAGLTVKSETRPCDDTLHRVLALYGEVYLDKYSAANPAYGLDWLRMAVESGVLSLSLVRGADGRIEAFAAEHVCDRALTGPMLGHDQGRPRELGLYRIAMSLSVARAAAEGLKVNYSGGAGVFKRNRGATPEIEYMAVFDRHLPPWRRAGYAALAWALVLLTPSLERIATR